MDYCGPKGIPLSEFLSWDDADQDAALMWQAYDRQRCSGCGTHPDEWDPEAGGDPDAYDADAYQCPGCARRERVEERLRKADTTPEGMRVVLRPHIDGQTAGEG